MEVVMTTTLPEVHIPGGVSHSRACRVNESMSLGTCDIKTTPMMPGEIRNKYYLR